MYLIYLSETGAPPALVVASPHPEDKVLIVRSRGGGDGVTGEAQQEEGRSKREKRGWLVQAREDIAAFRLDVLLYLVRLLEVGAGKNGFF